MQVFRNNKQQQTKKYQTFFLLIYLPNGHIVSSRDFGPPLQPIIARDGDC